MQDALFGQHVKTTTPTSTASATMSKAGADSLHDAGASAMLIEERPGPSKSPNELEKMNQTTAPNCPFPLAHRIAIAAKIKTPPPSMPHTARANAKPQADFVAETQYA
jgi:hypothetical protein